MIPVSTIEPVEQQPALHGNRLVLLVSGAETLRTVLRVGLFLVIIGALVWSLDAATTAGLRHMKTGIFGVTNLMVGGRINAQIVVTGSSRAASHFDPRVIHKTTGYTTFNLGRNGSQTDMQLAVLKTYLKHNRPPDIVVHNLDAFTFQTTREVYNPAQYIPYLHEDELYRPLKQINPDIWKSRYLPLYGYVAEDMSFAWTQGLKALVGWPQRENLFDGFDPRATKWTDEFARFRTAQRAPVLWDIEPAAERLTEELARLCNNKAIRLIFVYSPEFSEMQSLTGNRQVIFQTFRKIASRQHIPLWDYSDWPYAANTEYFTNSQHLNAIGAEVFSENVALKLKEYIDSEMPPTAPVKPAAGDVPRQTAAQ